MRKLVVAAAMVAIFALLVSPRSPAKGGNENGKGGSRTAAPSSITIEGYSELWLGGTVGFETNAVGLAGCKYPMYTVWPATAPPCRPAGAAGTPIAGPSRTHTAGRAA